ncbi:DNA helicase RecQ [Rhodomicrobium sp.]|uniref:DNA helicase RecQ n=1 Tax=Rhodomicrobium sp. TaxID=2720632 RepID=UPI0039E48B07
MGDLNRARDCLRKTFGFADFRAGQDDVISAVLNGSDVLAVMPTGGGKSLCYQLPALMREGLTVVVSPLIALMRNQVAQLQAYGIAAGALNSSNSREETASLIDAIANRRLRLLYVSPERLALGDTKAMLQRAGVSLLAIDEAHCVSQWGHDFRPDYLNLGEVAAALTGVQILALTATADTATRADILSRLFVREPAVFVHGFDRPNLRLAMRAKSDARRQLTEFIADHTGESGIVYCSARRQTEDLAAFLSGKGIPALAYHAGMDSAARSQTQDRFLQEDGLVMVATVAFGMGIDKPDVRFVAHANLPKSIEAYYQEIGRAGRDGLAASTLTLYGLDDMRLRRQQIEDSEAPDEQKRVERRRLDALVALCEAPRCRRQTLLAYFGESAEPCGNCDLCIEGVELVDGTILAQKALSAIARTGERFGTEHLIALLRGQQTDRITQLGHHDLPTFGVGSDIGASAWRAIFRQLYAGGVINLDVAGYGSWTITAHGRDVLRGKAAVELRKEALVERGQKSPSRSGSAAGGNAVALSASDTSLLEALKAIRRTLATDKQVPAYVIFPDKTLLDMVHLKPQTRDQMAMVHGVGAAKLDQYGDAFLAVVTDHLARVR